MLPFIFAIYVIVCSARKKGYTPCTDRRVGVQRSSGSTSVESSVVTLLTAKLGLALQRSETWGGTRMGKHKQCVATEMDEIYIVEIG